MKKKPRYTVCGQTLAIYMSFACNVQYAYRKNNNVVVHDNDKIYLHLVMFAGPDTLLYRCGTGHRYHGKTNGQWSPGSCRGNNPGNSGQIQGLRDAVL